MNDRSADSPRVRPVILSGGSGTRLWPLSRSLYPKQLLPLNSADSLLQETIQRVTGAQFAPPVVIANDEQRFLVAEQLRDMGVDAEAIILEPIGRNTAPAAGVAALYALKNLGDEPLLLLPSDHVIADVESFHHAIQNAVAAAADGRLVTFGISPTGPETGYGYIKCGPSIDQLSGCHDVEKFVEKPDEATAQSYLDEGGYYWNGGIFLFRPADLLAELEAQQPEMPGQLEQAVADAQQDLDYVRLDNDAFSKVTSISIDYAVMEGTSRAAVVPVDMGWSDLGAWDALWSISDKDADGNVLIGDVITNDVKNTYIRSDRQLIAATGIEDVVVVATADAVLVASMDDTQSVKVLVDQIKEGGRDETESHTRVYRPWGWYQSLEVGERFQVKLIELKPGAKISLQRHQKRAEHWVVVSGTATVTRDEERIQLEENQSTYIPIGMMHRLENETDQPLQIIEVQSGSYLGEDDIERFDDSYGRA